MSQWQDIATPKRNPHGNLLCTVHGSKMIDGGNGTTSGPWGVTCGYWRCNDDRCCLIEGDPTHFPMERKDAHPLTIPPDYA